MKNYEASQYREDLADSLKSARNEGDEGREKAHQTLEEARKTFEYRMAEKEKNKGQMKDYYLGDLEFFMDKENIEAVENYVEKEILPFIDKLVEERMVGEDKDFEPNHEWQTVRPWYCREDGAYCDTHIDNKGSGLNGYFKHDDVPSFNLKFNKDTEQVEFFMGDAEKSGYISSLDVKDKRGLGSAVAGLGEKLLDLSNQDIVVFKNFAIRKNRVEYKDYDTEKFTGKIERSVELTRNMEEVKKELLAKKQDIDRILEKIE